MPDNAPSGVTGFLKGPLVLTYVTYFWATWGNRMWNFAFGLYLVVLAEKNLRLTAIYGFLMSGSVLLFGSYIGNWVDRTNRQTAVRTSIILQKSLVIACSIAVCLTLRFSYYVSSAEHGYLCHVLHAVVVILAILAELATMSYQRIELEKDWFVVVTEGNESKLANLNTATRIIDQVTNIVTPIVTGIIMTSLSKLIAGAVIIAWHILAVFVEILLTNRIYAITPSLHHKNIDSMKELQSVNGINDVKENGKHFSSETESFIGSKSGKNVVHEYETKQEGKSCVGCSSICIGWRVYAAQIVVFAGVSLSLLYMTVLGFDGITTGYIYANGLSESLIGVATAASSIAGVIGALAYNQLHRCLGLERTGIISFTFQICCLTLCVASIWLPGSPFEPSALWDMFSSSGDGETSAVSVAGNGSTVAWNGSDLYTTEATVNDSSQNNITVSITIFVIAIVVSRIGLWVSDLVVCQLQQENVPETARGIVNGVQNSLNSFMDMLKSVLVIFLPCKETFGYLIMISFLFVACGVLTFYYHAFKVSGNSISSCCRGQTLYSKGSKSDSQDECKVEVT